MLTTKINVNLGAVSYTHLDVYKRQLESISRTCLEPGAIVSETLSAIVFPLRIFAAVIKSSYEEFVQLPIET